MNRTPLRQLLPVALALLALLPPGAQSAAAQPPGIAFVQAPEQAAGVAVAPTLDAARAGAVAGCVEGGALAEDCLLTTWCQPAGWSIDLFVMHAEGLHWHEVQCGLPDRAIAERVAATLCDLTARPDLTDCLLVQIHDPDGTPLLSGP